MTLSLKRPRMDKTTTDANGEEHFWLMWCNLNNGVLIYIQARMKYEWQCQESFQVAFTILNNESSSYRLELIHSAAVIDREMQ